MKSSGSAPAMEPEVAKRMFKQTVSCYKIQYNEEL